jgi:NarL family two-component system response regulator LiaR
MTETDRIRVIIVDDHAMLRRGLRFFLSGFDDLELVGEASGAKEAIDLCVQAQPDVVLMDLVMPGMNGVEATQAIRACSPGTQVVALTSFQEEDMVERALQNGAISYMLKNVSASDLARAIRDAHAGRSTLAPEATEALIQATRKRSDHSDHGLTERERQVLALMANGSSNSEIAEQLVISLSTVKFHVRGILSKLGVSSRAEAVSLAWQHDLV